MTRTAHHAHPTPSYPVYCLDWATDDSLLLGGGGGATKSGIQNKLKLCNVSKDGKKLKYLNELSLSNDEDAPMTMAVDRASKQLVTGINASQESIQSGVNDNVRVYSYGDEKIELVKGQKTIDAAWSDDFPYQKLSVISPSGKLLAVGSTDNKVAILQFPTLEPVTALSTDAELTDLDWGGPDGNWLAVTTLYALALYHLSPSLALTLKQTIFPPTLDIVPVAFRSARFSRSSSTPLHLHSVLNASKAAKRGGPRKAFVCTFGIVAEASKAPLTEEEKATAEKSGAGEEEDVGKWDVLAKREVAGKPVTAFDVSSDGKILSYGCSDLSIGILDARTLAPLLKILHAHSFPPTALKFNPSASLLVSASADNTVRVVVVPADFGGLSAPMIFLILTILILILALALKK
ncbi:hypothetical protein I350_08067 [Cryptococcus amylolentus CBS 6273]|uniref:Uncharacterized protein n=1 Tax=Cryptococcus amylolentus CBS 6273 TaxID=1296118 RepID=A0A1E3J8A3_9TREE|nr:hypothetical protein I350_08067 [Cryptococcus amylolentus CBS 6273]